MIDGVISILSGITIIIFACISFLGFWNEDWLQVGPNEKLFFIKVHINTYPRYFSLISLLTVVFAAKAIGDFYVDPWIQARYLGLVSQRLNDTWLSLHVSLWRLYSWMMMLLMVQIVLSQVDIWLWGVIVTIVVDLWITHSEPNREGFTAADIKSLKELAASRRRSRV